MEVLYKEIKRTYKNEIQLLVQENLKLIQSTKSENYIPLDFKCSVDRVVLPYIHDSPRTHFLSKTSHSIFTEDDPILRYVPSIRTTEPSQIEWFDGSSYGTKSFGALDMTDLIFIRHFEKLNDEDKAIDFIKNHYCRNLPDFERRNKSYQSFKLKDLFCSICLVFDCGIHKKINPNILRLDEKQTCICEKPILKKLPIKYPFLNLKLKPCIQRMIVDMAQPCRNFKTPSIPKKKIVGLDKDRNLRTFYEPCNENTNKCGCTSKNMNCEIICGCENCSNVFACKCLVCGPDCPCLQRLRQCTILCRSHKPGEKLEKCDNMLIFSASQKKVSICKSIKHGLGLFAEEFIPANKFVIEYTGELITDREAERRGNFYELNRTSYLFNSIFLDDYCLFSLDAYFLGNESRFINHSATNANLNSQLIISHGIIKIIFISKRDIFKGEEFLFDYRFENEHKQKHGLID